MPFSIPFTDCIILDLLFTVPQFLPLTCLSTPHILHPPISETSLPIHRHSDSSRCWVWWIQVRWSLVLILRHLSGNMDWSNRYKQNVRFKLRKNSSKTNKHVNQYLKYKQYSRCWLFYLITGHMEQNNLKVRSTGWTHTTKLLNFTLPLQYI